MVEQLKQNESAVPHLRLDTCFPDIGVDFIIMTWLLEHAAGRGHYSCYTLVYLPLKDGAETVNWSHGIRLANDLETWSYKACTKILIVCFGETFFQILMDCWNASRTRSPATTILVGHWLTSRWFEASCNLLMWHWICIKMYPRKGKKWLFPSTLDKLILSWRIILGRLCWKQIYSMEIQQLCSSIWNRNLDELSGFLNMVLKATLHRFGFSISSWGLNWFQSSWFGRDFRWLP